MIYVCSVKFTTGCSAACLFSYVQMILLISKCFGCSSASRQRVRISVKMAPRIPKANLDIIGATQTELEQAKAFIKSLEPKKKKSLMAGMVQWSNSNENKEKVTKARGEDRLGYLAAFHWHSVNNRKAESTLSSQILSIRRI